MQNNKGNLKTLNNNGGDAGISFFSHSSFNDTTLMMDTTGIGIPQNQLANKTAAIPKPPNDKMIHVSSCKNDKCPLQQVWKHQVYGVNGKGDPNKEFDQQFIAFYPCPKC